MIIHFIKNRLKKNKKNLKKAIKYLETHPIYITSKTNTYLNKRNVSWQSVRLVRTLQQTISRKEAELNSRRNITW